MSKVIECTDEAELQLYRDKLTKLRIIANDRADKNLFSKPVDKRDKTKLMRAIQELWDSLSDSEIDAEFNSICCDNLFVGGADLTKYPTADLRFPDHSILYNPSE